MMYTARILYPVEVLGPGKRVGIWMCGCPHRCIGCSNPELWEFSEKYRISLENLEFILKSLISTHPVDGFTLTGGEPFYQSQELSALVKFLSRYTDDILIYTGYTLDELKNIHYAAEILTYAGVLIDGRYVRELNKNIPMRGSENQKIHFLKKSLEEKYLKYMSENGNRIQNFSIGRDIVSVGIHRPDYDELLGKMLAEKGFEGGMEFESV